jgi:hypothetical protein
MSHLQLSLFIVYESQFNAVAESHQRSSFIHMFTSSADCWLSIFSLIFFFWSIINVNVNRSLCSTRRNVAKRTCLFAFEKATTSECECMAVSDNVKSNKHIHINDLIMCEMRHDKQQFSAIINDVCGWEILLSNEKVWLEKA